MAKLDEVAETCDGQARIMLKSRVASQDMTITNALKQKLEETAETGE